MDRGIPLGRSQQILPRDLSVQLVPVKLKEINVMQISSAMWSMIRRR